MYLLQFLNEEVVLDLSVSSYFGNSTISKQNNFVEVFKVFNRVSDEKSRFLFEFTQEQLVKKFFRNVFIKGGDGIIH
jgi:hypothetical protein